MPKNLKRYYGLKHLHFITFSCYQRRPLLRTARAKNVFVKALSTMRERYEFRLVGYVVMPEHVHLLISEPKKGDPSVVLKVLKQRVARDLRREKRSRSAQMCFPFLENAKGLAHFWQRRFYDFNVYSAKKKNEKLTYMHGNPVKRGLVQNPRDWIWSSYSFYGERRLGLVAIDPVD